MKVNEFFGINDSDMAILGFCLCFNDDLRQKIRGLLIVDDKEIKELIGKIDKQTLRDNHLLRDMVVINFFFLMDETRDSGCVKILIDNLKRYFPVEFVLETVSDVVSRIKKRNLPPDERINEYNKKIDELSNHLERNHLTKVRMSIINAGNSTTEKTCSGCGSLWRVGPETKHKICKKCRRKIKQETKGGDSEAEKKSKKS